ncbi:MAG: antibiotic biosynthesis monooxygenase [Candidatus Acidiferrales bacterium]
MPFIRHITLQLKKNSAPQFPAVIENEILPLLRKQKGFLDQVVLVAPNSTEVLAISVWENKEFAEIYNHESYPEVSRILNTYIDGLPVVKNFEVLYATLPPYEKFATAAAR